MNIGSDELVDDESEEYISFIKPQYEGESGQKLLKLKLTYGNDERFKLDERFAEKEEKPIVQEQDSERQLQLNILEKILGPTPKYPLDPNKVTNQHNSRRNLGRTDSFSVLSTPFERFDPTIPEHQKFLINPNSNKKHEHSDPGNTSKVPIVKQEEPPAKNKKKQAKEKDVSKAIEEEKEKLKNPFAKPTFKVVQNIGSLFSKDSKDTSEDSSFSILAAFGREDKPVGKTAEVIFNKIENSKPRSDWKKNPFKYDSSSEDEEDKDHSGTKGHGTSKKQVNQIRSKNFTMTQNAGQSTKNQKSGVQRNKYSSSSNCSNNIFKPEKFFYSSNDSRLDGIFESFLKSDEDLGEISEKFKKNFHEQKELKAIALIKVKNAKRKQEQKINFVKLKNKKKKREMEQRQKKLEASSKKQLKIK